MGNKTTTAKDFLWNGKIITRDDTEAYGHLPSEKIPLVMIEFAKMHVQKALKEASEKAELDYFNGGCRECGSNEINRQSILNAYDLNNIK